MSGSDVGVLLITHATQLEKDVRKCDGFVGITV